MTVRTRCAINLSHAPASNLADDAVGPDALLRSARRFCHWEKIECGLAQEIGARLFVGGQERLHFAAKVRVLFATVLKIAVSRACIQHHRFADQLLDSLPSFRIHAGVSPVMARNSHARAIIHSRFTVAGEMPRTSDVSSMVRPLKERSSTMRLCWSSCSESSVSARSSAIMSRFTRLGTEIDSSKA